MNSLLTYARAESLKREPCYSDARDGIPKLGQPDADKL
jgi:hypothetical protein